MEPLQPSKPAGMSGIPPLTEEWFLQQKKLLTAAKIETPPAAYPQDIANLTPQAEKELTHDKYDNFLEEVKQHILKLDPNSPDYLPQATSRLVWAALKREYGENLTRSSAYPQMESIIVRKILGDNSHTDAIQDFLGLLTSTETSEKENPL